MRSLHANEDLRLLFWLRVREFAVPPSMIKSATSRRAVGDWAGACAAARVDVDLDLRAVGNAQGREFANRIRDDLRHLAPDLLRWHMPRSAPDGLMRPGLTISLARYPSAGLHLAVRTAPTWADAGQRISLALWSESTRNRSSVHPHPRPDPRFRLDLHRHLWDVRRAGELSVRSGAMDAAGEDGCAVGRWPAEAAILRGADGLPDTPVAVRLGGRRWLALDPRAPEFTAVPIRNRTLSWPVLPDAATWTLPDAELLRAGLVSVDDLHPVVALALGSDRATANSRQQTSGDPRLVDCRGAQHRIGVRDGVLVPLDHDPDEIRREGLLVALGGKPLSCLQAIDEAHRHPECLVDVRGRLDHGDTEGALAIVEDLLGPDALLRDGPLRDELQQAAYRQVTHGEFRAGLTGFGPLSHTRDAIRRTRARRLRATSR